jgi:hypothetical protein
MRPALPPPGVARASPRGDAARFLPGPPTFTPAPETTSLTLPIRAAVRTACALLLAAAACRPQGAGDAAPGDPAAGPREGCEQVGATIVLPDELRESSGMEPAGDSLFWTHNDSGGEPVLYAVGRDGEVRGRVRLRGAANRDWEDLAAGPCGAGRCLYVADIGDNAAVHPEVVIWRVPEPAPGDGIAPAERFAARYPGGPRDAESLFVLPDGSVYLLTKGRDTPVELYRWPVPLAPGPVELEPVRTLAPQPEQTGDMVTGAASSPDGRWVAVRTYSTLAFYRTDALLGNGGPALTVDLVPLGEPQGEAVAFGPGDTVLLTSEAAGGSPARATVLRCTLPN